jgi:hypothetical protein
MIKRPHFLWYALITLLVGALLIAVKAEVVRSTSVDLAHNYALAFRLSENWHLVPNDPTLGEMNFYPRGSHMAAAFLGKLVGSTFLGLHLVSLVALILIWASCLAILYAVPKGSGPFNALALAGVVLLNAGSLRIHGAEISGQYYFAQFVAQSLVFVAMAVAVRLDGKVQRAWLYLFLLGMLYLTTSVHLLPAVELLGVLAGLAVLDMVFPRGQPQARLPGVLLAAAALASGIALVVLHPSFAAMRAIGGFNAGIALGLLNPLWSIVLVSLIVLASALSLLRTWYRDRSQVVHQYLALYGGAVSGLFLIQVVLNYLGLGSEYAAKKYSYGLATFLLLRLALWLGPKVHSRIERKPRLARFCNSSAGRLVVFGIALAVASAGAARARRTFDTMDVVAIERQVIALHDTSLPAPVPGKPNLVLGTGVRDVIDYMFSIALVRTPREAALQVFEGGETLRPFSHASQFGFILTSRDHSPFKGADRCSTVPAGPLLVLDGGCVEKAAGAHLPGPAAVAR